MKVIVKKPGVAAEVVDVDYTYRGECSRLIDDESITTEYVNIGTKPGFVMMLDEDGLPKRLPLNFFMSMNNPFYPVQAIVGTVVFCRFKWENPWEKELWDFELESVTENDMELVGGLLGDAAQGVLRARWMQRGR